jgi:hypothetical protein
MSTTIAYPGSDVFEGRDARITLEARGGLSLAITSGIE